MPTIEHPANLYPEPGMRCWVCLNDGDIRSGRFPVLEVELRNELRGLLRDEYAERGIDWGPLCENCSNLTVVDGDHTAIMESIREKKRTRADEAAAHRRADEATIARKLAGESDA